MNDEVEQVSFECSNCHGVITLGVVGGVESLGGDVPPSCLYCRSVGTLEYNPDATPAEGITLEVNQ